MQARRTGVSGRRTERTRTWLPFALVAASGCQLALGFEDFAGGGPSSPSGAGAGGGSNAGGPNAGGAGSTGTGGSSGSNAAGAGAGGAAGAGERVPLAASAVSAGKAFSCALRASPGGEGGAATSGGELLCWGANDAGQLGVEAGDARPDPRGLVDDAGNPFRTATRPALGADFLCTLGTQSLKTAFCWGQNDAGQRGNGTYNQSAGATLLVEKAGSIAPRTDLAGLGLGGRHGCASTTEGKALCWGSNEVGQLGRSPDDLSTSSAPEIVTDEADTGGALVGVIQIAAGERHSCAVVDPGGRALCWGSNELGQLGRPGSSSYAPSPVQGDAAELGGVTRVVAGASFGCALVGNGVRCWGANDAGQVGSGGPDGSYVTAQAVVDAASTALSDVVEVAAGARHACARRQGGLLCWGANDRGQLGPGPTVAQSNVARPVADPSGGELTGVEQVALGEGHTCALLAGGRLLCWGDNRSGQLGDGSKSDAPHPTPVVVSETVVPP
jgi:alpha-tubulin suppressor-like RCC1 family protein